MENYEKHFDEAGKIIDSAVEDRQNDEITERRVGKIGLVALLTFMTGIVVLSPYAILSEHRKDLKRLEQENIQLMNNQRDSTKEPEIIEEFPEDYEPLPINPSNIYMT